MARDMLKPVPRFSKKVLGTKLNHDNFHGTIFTYSNYSKIYRGQLCLKFRLMRIATDQDSPKMHEQT